MHVELSCGEVACETTAIDEVYRGRDRYLQGMPIVRTSEINRLDSSVVFQVKSTVRLEGRSSGIDVNRGLLCSSFAVSSPIAWT